MKALIISPDLDYYRDFRGIYRYSIRLIKSLKDLGFELDMVVSAKKNRYMFSSYGDRMLCTSIIGSLSTRGGEDIDIGLENKIRLPKVVKNFLGIKNHKLLKVENSYYPVEESQLPTLVKEFVTKIDNWMLSPGFSKDLVNDSLIHINPWNAMVVDGTEYDYVFTTQPYRVKVKNSKLITIVHDLFPITCSWHDTSNIDYLCYRFIKSIRYSDKLICISEETKKSLLAFMRSSRLNESFIEDKINVITQSVKEQDANSLSSSLQNKGLQKNSYMTIGTIEERKNQHELVNLFTEDPTFSSFELNIVGAADINYLKFRLPELYKRACVKLGANYNELSKAINIGVEFEVKYKNIRWACNASDERKNYLLQTSNAMIFPTLAEGYGIPIVEAMSLGIPVIARDLDVFRVISKNIDYYKNISMLKKSILKYSGSIQRLQVLIDESISLVDDSAFSAKLKKVLLD